MEQDKKEKEEKGSEEKFWPETLALAFELGYTIAIPIVGFALLGRLADRFFGSSPFLILAGVLVSIFLSSWLIYKKVAKIIK